MTDLTLYPLVEQLYLPLLHKGTVSGGSTITQQLAKNMYFSFEKTYARKVAELIVAVQLEEKLSKNEILELYANMIYFGNGNYGVCKATVDYFGKEPKDITVEEGGYAMLLLY